MTRPLIPENSELGMAQVRQRVTRLERRPAGTPVQKPSAGVTRLATSPQSIPSSTNTAISFTTELWDTAGLYAAGQPTRLTPDRSGYWLCTVDVQWAASAGATRRVLRVREGLTGVEITTETQAAVSQGTYCSLSGVFRFVNAPASGEYLEVQVWQDSGADLVVNVDDAAWNIVYIGAL